MDKARPVEVDLLKLLAEQQYRELALAYELEGNPVPAHVATEANHLAVVAALVDGFVENEVEAGSKYLNELVEILCSV
eukprot:SAG11_NODE_3821_length_2207_cov_2.433586_2_plen_78_part_00